MSERKLSAQFNSSGLEIGILRYIGVLSIHREESNRYNTVMTACSSIRVINHTWGWGVLNTLTTSEVSSTISLDDHQ